MGQLLPEWGSIKAYQPRRRGVIADPDAPAQGTYSKLGPRRCCWLLWAWWGSGPQLCVGCALSRPEMVPSLPFSLPTQTQGSKAWPHACSSHSCHLEDGPRHLPARENATPDSAALLPPSTLGRVCPLSQGNGKCGCGCGWIPVQRRGALCPPHPSYSSTLCLALTLSPFAPHVQSLGAQWQECHAEGTFWVLLLSWPKHRT